MSVSSVIRVMVAARESQQGRGITGKWKMPISSEKLDNRGRNSNMHSTEGHCYSVGEWRGEGSGGSARATVTEGHC